MSARPVTPIRALQLGVGVLVGVVAPIGVRSCSHTPGPAISTFVGAPLLSRASVDHRFSDRVTAPLRLGLLEVGEWRSGCTGFFGPALRFRERSLQLPSRLETPEASFAAMASEGEELLVLAFESPGTVDLIETRNGGHTFEHLASVVVQSGSRVQGLKADHDFLELDLEVESPGSPVSAALSFALGRNSELHLSSFDRGAHFSSALGDWLLCELDSP